MFRERCNFCFSLPPFSASFLPNAGPLCVSRPPDTARRNPLLSTRAKKGRALIYIQQILPRRYRSLSRQERTDNPPSPRLSRSPLLAAKLDATLYSNVSRVTKSIRSASSRNFAVTPIRVKFRVHRPLVKDLTPFSKITVSFCMNLPGRGCPCQEEP